MGIRIPSGNPLIESAGSLRLRTSIAKVLGPKASMRVRPGTAIHDIINWNAANPSMGRPAPLDNPPFNGGYRLERGDGPASRAVYRSHVMQAARKQEKIQQRVAAARLKAKMPVHEREIGAAHIVTAKGNTKKVKGVTQVRRGSARERAIAARRRSL